MRVPPASKACSHTALPSSPSVCHASTSPPEGSATSFGAIWSPARVALAMKESVSATGLGPPLKAKRRMKMSVPMPGSTASCSQATAKVVLPSHTTCALKALLPDGETAMPPMSTPAASRRCTRTPVASCQATATRARLGETATAGLVPMDSPTVMSRVGPLPALSSRRSWISVPTFQATALPVPIGAITMFSRTPPPVATVWLGPCTPSSTAWLLIAPTASV